ncbi:MAG: hypothetical protein ACRDS9_07710 [Pseudonocardiaceae bacterium]
MVRGERQRLPSLGDGSSTLFFGASEMATRIRAMDWSGTPVGPIQGWPQSLCTAVGIMLESRFPMLIWWGPELTMIYNDAYVPILGDKHRLRTVRELGDFSPVNVRTVANACAAALRVLARNRADVPYALAYVLDDDATGARLVSDAEPLHLEVCDHGRWRASLAPGPRGRDLKMIKKLTDTLTVDPGNHSTTIRIRTRLPL